MDIELSPQEKLAALRTLDQFRRWDSLEDRRRCLQCGRTITGTQIRVMGPAPFHLQCPTPACSAIPMDWSLLILVREPQEVDLNGYALHAPERLQASG